MITVDDTLEQFSGVSLDELDRRASLLRRTDTKYAPDEQALIELLERLAADHEILDIDGRRSFVYESVYFDTPELRCFHDHVEDRIPRFKARTRLYRDTGYCVFEVKLKIGEGETDKRQVDHDPDALETIDGGAQQCLHEALESASVPALERSLEPSLITRFTRFTLAPATGAERITCDRRIVLERPGAGAASLRHGVVVVETKSEQGTSAADQALGELGVQPLSLSKYRTGIALLIPDADDPDSPRPSEGLFELV